jgi:alkylation response protein AidB-like acyl-CoA dehydrogenase
MVTNTTATPEDLVAQVEPVLRQYAGRAESERRLAPQAVNAILDAGLLKSLTPRAYGGFEMEPVAALRLFEAVSRIDSAAGWITANSSGIATLPMLLPAEGAAELFSQPRTLLAGGWFPPGKAVPVQGGYRVSGRWAFGSGSNYATWLTGQALVYDNGTPRLGPDGNPVAMIIWVRADEAEVLDNWDTLGMRGTGSHDFRADDVFVPERRTWTIAPITGLPEAYAGPLYRLGLWVVGPINASVALGIARAAVEDAITLAASKTPSYTQTGLADRPVVQDRIARAQAQVEAGRSYIESAVTKAWEHTLRTGARIGPEYGIPMALAGSYGHEAAAQAVDLVHSVVGTSGIRAEQPFQQYFRDVHTVSQHAFSSPSRFESVGKILLGRESDWGFYYL